MIILIAYKNLARVDALMLITVIPGMNTMSVSASVVVQKWRGLGLLDAVRRKTPQNNGHATATILLYQTNKNSR